MAQDHNGDGVSLLMAYALGLDPTRDLRTSLPVPSWSNEQMSLDFFGDAPDINYQVETSTNLRDWTTEGVTLPEAGPDGMRRATVPSDGPRRFIRLVVGIQDIPGNPGGGVKPTCCPPTGEIPVG